MWRRGLFALLLVIELTLPLGAFAAPSVDRLLTDGGVCWVPDDEFPEPCDDDDD